MIPTGNAGVSGSIPEETMVCCPGLLPLAGTSESGKKSAPVIIWQMLLFNSHFYEKYISRSHVGEKEFTHFKKSFSRVFHNT